MDSTFDTIFWSLAAAIFSGITVFALRTGRIPIAYFFLKVYYAKRSNNPIVYWLVTAFYAYCSATILYGLVAEALSRFSISAPSIWG